MLNELEHYGVLGMKWGIRRYQPYPSGNKKGVYVGDEVGHKPLRYRSKAIKTLRDGTINIGLRVLSQLIPGVSEIRLANAIRLEHKYNWDSKDYVKKDGAYEKISELSKKNSKTTPEEDMKMVDRGHRSGQINNCGFCTATMEMRRRGYDVRARRKAQGVSTDGYKNWFDGLKMESSRTERKEKQSMRSWVNESYDNLCKSLEQKGNGARGFVAFSYRGQGSGHTLFWEVQNGSVDFYDGQSGKKNPGDVFSFSDQDYLYGRLDTCKLKPEITETCVSRDFKEKQKRSLT